MSNEDLPMLEAETIASEGVHTEGLTEELQIDAVRRFDKHFSRLNGHFRTLNEHMWWLSIGIKVSVFMSVVLLLLMILVALDL